MFRSVGALTYLFGKRLFCSLIPLLPGMLALIAIVPPLLWLIPKDIGSQLHPDFYKVVPLFISLVGVVAIVLTGVYYIYRTSELSDFQKSGLLEIVDKELREALIKQQHYNQALIEDFCSRNKEHLEKIQKEHLRQIRRLFNWFTVSSYALIFLVAALSFLGSILVGFRYRGLRLMVGIVLAVLVLQLAHIGLSLMPKAINYLVRKALTPNSIHKAMNAFILTYKSDLRAKENLDSQLDSLADRVDDTYENGSKGAISDP